MFPYSMMVAIKIAVHYPELKNTTLNKFADIGKTVKAQFTTISSWADLVTVHGLPGPGVLDGLNNGTECRALIVAEMSSKGKFTGCFFPVRLPLGQNTECSSHFHEFFAGIF